MRVSFLVIVLTILYSNPLNAQEMPQPAPMVYENKALSEGFERAYKVQLERNDDLKGKEKGKVKESLQGRREMMVTMLEKGDFVFESPVLDYLQEIFDRILEANPQIDPNTRLLLSRSGEPNAFSTGDGFFMINLGIVIQMQSTDEMAFVIGHELSHQVGDHGFKMIRDRASLTADPERQKEIKRILRSEYQVLTQLENFILPGMMASMQFSRDYELEADAMGADFATKAGFSALGAINALDVLDKVDERLYSEDLPWLDIFSNLACEVKPVWESKKEPGLGTFDIAEKDYVEKLKSHPDCKIRVAHLMASHKIDTSHVNSVLDKKYQIIQRIAQMELIESYRFRQNYGRALYHALRLYLDHPDMVYAPETVAHIFGLTSLFKKQRYMGKYYGQSHPGHQQDYNNFLNVIWEMSSDECACMAFNLLKGCSKIAIPEEHLSARAISSYVNGEAEEAHKLAQEYISTYPKGNHIERMYYIIKRN